MERNRVVHAKRPPLSARRLADKVFRVADLVAIRLNKCFAQHDLEGKKNLREVKMKIHASADQNDDAKRLRVTVAFDVEAKPEGHEPQSLQVGCEFILMYHLESLDGIEDEHVEAFTKWIGINNAWPFAREFVQDVSVRMGFQPLRMPLYKPEHMRFETPPEPE